MTLLTVLKVMAVAVSFFFFLLPGMTEPLQAQVSRQVGVILVVCSLGVANILARLSKLECIP